MSTQTTATTVVATKVTEARDAKGEPARWDLHNVRVRLQDGKGCAIATNGRIMAVSRASSDGIDSGFSEWVVEDNKMKKCGNQWLANIRPIGEEDGKYPKAHIAVPCMPWTATMIFVSAKMLIRLLNAVVAADSDRVCLIVDRIEKMDRLLVVNSDGTAIGVAMPLIKEEGDEAKVRNDYKEILNTLIRLEEREER